MTRLRRIAGYVWASPASAVGLMGASLALWRGHIERHQGVLEAHGPLLRWALARLSVLPGGIAAITLGHVVLARDAHTLHSTRAHERVHVRQYERWGVFMLPAYGIASAWAWARGRHAYFDNRFERQAFGNHEEERTVAEAPALANTYSHRRGEPGGGFASGHERHEGARRTRRTLDTDTSS